jgi:hypothetical protein
MILERWLVIVLVACLSVLAPATLGLSGWSALAVVLVIWIAAGIAYAEGTRG